jgi:hypothetical protein
MELSAWCMQGLAVRRIPTHDRQRDGPAPFVRPTGRAPESCRSSGRKEADERVKRPKPRGVQQGACRGAGGGDMDARVEDSGRDPDFAGDSVTRGRRRLGANDGAPTAARLRAAIRLQGLWRKATTAGLQRVRPARADQMARPRRSCSFSR